MKYLNKIIFLLFMAGAVTLNSKAQSTYGDNANYDNKMNYVYSLEEALKLAKEQNKLIFFNCFADWAVPCHSMNKVVFSDKEFGDYMNKTFINLFLDLSHKVNIPIKDKYKVRFFAHYLVLNSDGDVVHRIGRGFPLPDFKNKVMLSLNPKTSLAGMQKEYAKGNRKTAFLSEYYHVVSDAGYDDIADEVRDLYVKNIPKSDIAKKENWKIYQSLTPDIESEWFAYLKSNKALFIKHNGEKEIKDFVALKYMRALMPFFSSTVGYSQQQMDAIMKDLKDFKIDPSSDAYIYYNLAYKRNRAKLSDFVDYLEKNIDKIHATYATGIDLALKNIINVTQEEKGIITSYLSRRMSEMTGSNLQLYQTAVKEIKLENGIIFENGDFTAALKKAKAENKLIFFDAYTTWCGPCKVMAQQVFTIDEIGKYFNEKFVNFKMDMESGEGPKWAKEFNVSAYPTFLLINGDGQVVHKIVGAHPPREFHTLVSNGLVKETSYAFLKNEYEKGNRDPKIIRDYMKVMQSAGDLREPAPFLEQYISSLTDVQKNSPYIWPIVEHVGLQIDHPLWKNIVNNKESIRNLMSDTTFTAAIDKVYGTILYNGIAQNEKGADFNQAKTDLANFDLPKNSLLSNLLKINELAMTSDYNAIIKFYKTDVQNMSDPKGKTNMDLLWKYFISALTQDQKVIVLDYLKNQHANAAPKAINSYKNLLDVLL